MKIIFDTYGETFKDSTNVSTGCSEKCYRDIIEKLIYMAF